MVVTISETLPPHWAIYTVFGIAGALYLTMVGYLVLHLIESYGGNCCARLPVTRLYIIVFSSLFSYCFCPNCLVPSQLLLFGLFVCQVLDAVWKIDNPQRRMRWDNSVFNINSYQWQLSYQGKNKRLVGQKKQEFKYDMTYVWKSNSFKFVFICFFCYRSCGSFIRRIFQLLKNTLD